MKRVAKLIYFVLWSGFITGSTVALLLMMIVSLSEGVTFAVQQ